MSMEDGLNSQETNEVTREQVIEALVANPDDVELLGKFIDQLQAKVESSEITDFDLNMELAKLYEEAATQNNDPRLLELVADTYYGLAEIAMNQIKDEALYEEMVRKYKEWDSKPDNGGKAN